MCVDVDIRSDNQIGARLWKDVALESIALGTEMMTDCVDEMSSTWLHKATKRSKKS